jgi:flagellar motor switch protein FliN/FliY
VANANDDVLDPAEIEALLNSAGRGGTPPQAVPASVAGASPDVKTQSAAGTAGSHAMSPGDIDALLKQHNRAPAAVSPEILLEQASARLAEAVAPDLARGAGNGDRTSAARPFELRAFNEGASAETAGELGNLKDVELNVRIELGRTELLIEDVLKLREGSVVALDKLAGDPVDILVNGRLVARGEVLVLNDNFCVRVAEILAPALV